MCNDLAEVASATKALALRCKWHVFAKTSIGDGKKEIHRLGRGVTNNWID